MTSKSSNTQAQAAYKARMRAAGFELVAVWVPREARDKIQRIAAELRERKQREEGTDTRDD